MTLANEIKIGLFFWAVGISGFIWTIFYVTIHEEILFLLFGGLAVMGFALFSCAIIDIVTDDFEDEIRDSYDPNSPDKS